MIKNKSISEQLAGIKESCELDGVPLVIPGQTSRYCSMNSQSNNFVKYFEKSFSHASTYVQALRFELEKYFLPFPDWMIYAKFALKTNIIAVFRPITLPSQMNYEFGPDCKVLLKLLDVESCPDAIQAVFIHSQNPTPVAIRTQRFFAGHTEIDKKSLGEHRDLLAG